MQYVKKNFSVVLLSLLIYLPLSHLVDRTWSVIEWNRQREPLWFQTLAFKAITRSGGPPKTISEIALDPLYPDLGRQYQRYMEYYDPNAWEDPHRMLLLYRKGPFLWATFGDGMQAVMTHWVQPNPVLKAGESKARPLSMSGDVPYLENYPRVLVLGAIAILISTFVNFTFSRPRTTTAREKDSERNMPYAEELK
jgi:hypothetical protein